MSLNKTTLKKMGKDALVEHILKIQKEIEELKDPGMWANEDLETQARRWRLTSLGLDEQCEKLKKENEELKYKLNDEKIAFGALEDEFRDWKKMYEEAIADRNRESEQRLAESEKNARDMTKWSDLAASLKEENAKLKEQFKILNDFCGGIPDNDGQAIVDWICSFMVYEDENNKLKEKLTSIQDAIKDVL